MGAYSKQINDLAGIGEVVRQFWQFAIFLIRHRSQRDSRKLQNHAQQLRNDELALKNQHSRLQYTKTLLALAEKYKCEPSELQNLTDVITTHKEERQTLPCSAQSDTQDFNQKAQSAPLTQVILAVSSSRQQRRIRAARPTKPI